MIDIQILIFSALCVIILLLLCLIQNEENEREDFQITNDVPQEKRIETNYLKQILKQVKEVFPSVCSTDPRCGDNVNESWCNKNVKA